MSDGPTPSQIAGRAYDLAMAVALDFIEDEKSIERADLRRHMLDKRAATLAELRETVIVPSVVPWWRMP